MRSETGRPQFVRAIAIALAVWIVASERQSAQAPSQKTPAFRTSISLLTIDAVVVDADGRHVTGLTADDFELVESGRTVRPRQAVYVKAEVNAARHTQGLPPPPRDLASLGAPLNVPRVDAGARTVAIVVDDLGLSFESTVAVREALQRFVERQVQPGDLVAILRTAGGVGALQQFTTDKRLLQSAAEAVQWTPFGRGGVGWADPTSFLRNTNDIEDLRTSVFISGALGAVEAAVSGLQHLPGRKAIVFFSEGFDAFEVRRHPRVWSAMTRLIDRANRAGVVLYAIDPRGLVYVAPGEPARAFHMTQEGLRFVAAQTGGFAVLNNNDLNLGLERVLEDQQGYYLIGYEPPDERGAWRPDRVEVRVNRAGLRVRARRGSFGPASPDRVPEPSEPLEFAARSPFAASDVTVRLTTLFGYDAKIGSYVHALLLLDPNDVRFTRQEGAHEAQLEVLLLAVGDNGRVGARWHNELTVQLNEQEYEAARQRGLVRSIRFTAALPGPFQVRAAVRDKATGAIGSASQFLVVPKVGRGQVAVSGVLMRELASGASTTSALLDERTASSDVLGEPTIRVFRPGSQVLYACHVYDGSRAEAPVVLTTTLLRGGQVVFRSPLSQLGSGSSRGELRTIPVAGTVSLGPELQPGPYVLQVSIGRMRRGQMETIASQWSDFEVR